MQVYALMDTISDLKEITMHDIIYGSEEHWKEFDRLVNIISQARIEKNEN